MKQFTLTICSAAILLFSCNDNTEKSASATTDSSATAEKMTTTETSTPAPPPDSAAMMKAWQDFMTPGDNHKWLEKTNGTWEAEVSQWMDPAAPPTKAKAVNVQSSVLGGRYVINKFSSSMMGQPMEGIGTTGYDNSKKMFVSTWIDNMGSGIIYMTGTIDSKTGILNLKGFQTDPITGKDMDTREEMKVIDDNTYSMSIYGTGMDGKEMKYMEGTFKRKK